MSANDRLRLIKLIHVGRRELGMDDETYRTMLSSMRGLDGATSTADLTIPSLYRVLEVLKQKGFKVRPKAKASRQAAADPQSKKIRALWLILRDKGALRDPSEAALVKFVQRETGVQALQWLTPEQASRVIEHLKKWLARL